MKITEIKTYPVWVGRRNQLLVKVETDKGIYGWGEAGLSGRELAVAGAVQHYRHFLLGRDPMKRAALWQEMYRSQYFEGGRALTAAISAIDIALYDIAGKALGVPVYELLGGRCRDRIECFATIFPKSADDLIEQSRKLIADGWTCLRYTLILDEDWPEDVFEPREAIARNVDALIRARAELGRETVLGLECHHRFSVAEAAALLQALPPGTLDYVEEPIRDESPEAYAQLRAMTPVPLAVGEEFSSKWQFLPYLERGLTNFARMDICNVGGFTEAMKVAGMAEARYIDLMPHNPLGQVCTAASLHMCAAAPNFCWLEHNRFLIEYAPDSAGGVFKKAPEFEGHAFSIPEGPGLGVEVNEDALNEPFRPWEPPHWRRRDGSYTNW